MKEQKEIAETIKAVINTLNHVDVRGRDNMDRLLGSIITLERCAAQIQAQKETEAKKE